MKKRGLSGIRAPIVALVEAESGDDNHPVVKGADLLCWASSADVLL
jgi:hypothetical protein